MKRVALCLGLAAAMLMLAVGAYYFIESTSNSLIGKVQFVEKAFDEKEYEVAYNAAVDAEEEWSNFVKMSIFISDREHALEISNCFIKIKVLARQKDEEIFSECEVVKNLVQMFHDEQKPSIMNIL